MLNSASALAGWQATINRMGYFGRIGAGVIYDWDFKHSLELSFGIFSIDDKDYGQANLAYRFSGWKVERDDFVWAPMQVGAFATRSLENHRYFRASPAKYPSSDYYDQTALRGGLEFGTTLIHTKSRLGFSYQVRVIDSGIIVIYNNANRDLQYYVSSGLSLRYQF